MKLLTIYAIACAVLFAGLLATPSAQQPNGATLPVVASAAGVEPKRTQELTDLEDLAKTTAQLFQTRMQAIMADVLKAPEIAELQKKANDTAARANDALTKACGLDPKTHMYDFTKRVCIEKPKEPEQK